MRRIETEGEFYDFMNRRGAWGYVDDFKRKRRRVILSYRDERATCSLTLLSMLCSNGWIDCFPGSIQFRLSAAVGRRSRNG